MKTEYMGIGIGASRVKVISVSEDLNHKKADVVDHHGDPKVALQKILATINPKGVRSLVVTGREGCAIVNGRRIGESEAMEEALRVLGLHPDLVVSFGGESFVVYPMGSDGIVLDHVSGNRCAAGTVEFFKQQLGRMGLSIEQAADAARGGKLVPLAKRCSVHCKSDCTHALNRKKCTVPDIVFTLCHNMAEKVAGLIRSASVQSGTLVAVGGATANPVIMKELEKQLPDFKIIIPAEAEYFEAFGAASLARKESSRSYSKWDDVIREMPGSFGILPPLTDSASNVTFLPARRGQIRSGKKYILGIDGGSTTTKAVLVDRNSLEICAGYYTKTNGDPESAMKECLSALAGQTERSAGPDGIKIVGVATTGSSGEILSVLSDTQWTHNEIIAHAHGASHYCPDVDTIFEIGGQDSKFSSLKQKVAVDFNMNESCSAGTGSFIEETAKEDLGVPLEQISDLALSAKKPLRFSNQCAAFANSDTRKAFQEGATKEDNLAGLIYAIVENYLTKVVGHRKIGDHILFQGGTSKNKAIACAFAAKTGKRIIIPPDSELMGCYGIALWLCGKMAMGEAIEREYDLKVMLAAKVDKSQEFTCKSCENFCTISNLKVNGKTYPFGGKCSRWENVRKNKQAGAESLDLVALRNKMLFNDYGVEPYKGSNGERPHMGMLGVFSTYSLYPLYSWFFHELGYAIDLSENVDPIGVQKCQSARCYPYEIAHGTFQSLASKGVRQVFVPHVVGMPKDVGGKLSLSCPMAQGVPYYLSSAFESAGVTIHGPVIDFSNGIESTEQIFVDLAVSMGHEADVARSAFQKGCKMQHGFWSAVKNEGAKILAKIEREKGMGIVVVGRPYNAFSRLANMGVPQKFASLGVTVIPCEFLPYENETCDDTMYWKYGQVILKSMRFVEKHPNLFPVYISNFGCGPDSFIQHFAAKILGKKPGLFLEFDSHTADAGVATRVAAFLDIAAGYNKSGNSEALVSTFKPAEFIAKGNKGYVRTSDGELVSINNPRVTLAFPSMGKLNTEALAAASRRYGFNGIALPPADEMALAIGKEFTSGKECVPAQLTVGSLINYWRQSFRKTRKDEILLFFMPTADGPCRFGQYNVYIKMLIEQLKMADVAVFSLSAEDGYGGLGLPFVMSAWVSVVVSNIMDDVKVALSTAAENRVVAMGVFDYEWQKLITAISQGYKATWKALKETSETLSRIKLKTSPGRIPKVLLAGEIFVRCDELACQKMQEHYADAGIMLKRADTMEWIYYTDWRFLQELAGKGNEDLDFLGAGFFLKKLTRAFITGNRNSRKFVMTRIKLILEQMVEKKVRGILLNSGLLLTRPHRIDHVVKRGTDFMNTALTGEAILSAGSACEVMEHSEENYCGVVFIGPFNCMPNGVAESVIKPYARKKGIPYLTFETDAGPMPSNFKSQMEVHMLRAKRYGRSSQNVMPRETLDEKSSEREESVFEPQPCIS